MSTVLNVSKNLPLCGFVLLFHVDFTVDAGGGLLEIEHVAAQVLVAPMTPQFVRAEKCQTRGCNCEDVVVKTE